MRCAAVMADGFHTCGSYAFNLLRNGIDQGALCDVHYWQDKAEKLKALNAELAEAIKAFIDYDNDEDAIGSMIAYDAALRKCRAALAKHKGDIAALAEQSAKLEGLRKDGERLDWLAANPVDALDIFGHMKTREERFIRQDIDAAITKEKAK